MAIATLYVSTTTASTNLPKEEGDAATSSAIKVWTQSVNVRSAFSNTRVCIAALEVAGYPA
jgi:hypothetical protein